MKTVIPAGFAEITTVLAPTLDPSPATFTIGTDGITDVASLNLACASWVNALSDPDGVLGMLCSDYTILRVEGRTDPEGSNLVAEVPLGVVGLGGPETLPSNCALLIRKVTGLGGRRNRGRVFLPGCIGESQVSNTGLINPADAVAALEAWEVTTDAYTALGNDLYLFHNDEVRNPAFPPPSTVLMANPDPDPTLITSWVLDPVIATQRRRMR